MKYLRENILVLAMIALTMVMGFLILTAAINGGESTAAGHGEAAGAAEQTVLKADLTEFSIDGNLIAAEGDVAINVSNLGSVEHNLVVEDIARSADLANGESDVVVMEDLPAGTYKVFCDIAGHEAAGMTSTLVVTGDAVVAGEGEDHGGHGGHGDGADWEALDAAMIDSILAFPAETEAHGNQPLEPEILADGTKYFELTAQIVPWEVEPGKFVEAWTYNGQVPGPIIKVDVGDNVRVRVINELPMGTDVHWHGIRTPFAMDGVAPVTQDLILSGTEFTYEFVAERPAIGMYHAHHHAQMQVPNGMFGVFQIGELPIPRGRTISGVEIPSDLEVAVELPMVLNDAGVIGYSLNGKSFPATQPIVVDEGDWIAVTYYNEGLQIHPMHLHQFPQLVFAKDGIPLDEPYWADTVNVAPGERFTVLTQADVPGVWVWHCHILTHVENDEGMFGMVTAIVVNEKS